VTTEGCAVEVRDGRCGHSRAEHKEVNMAGNVGCWRCQEQARGGPSRLHMHEFTEASR
jgi:hypothetical protein